MSCESRDLLIDAGFCPCCGELLTSCDALQETRARLKRKLERLKTNSKETDKQLVKNNSAPAAIENIDKIIDFIEGNQEKTKKTVKKKKRTRNKSNKKNVCKHHKNRECKKHENDKNREDQERCEDCNQYEKDCENCENCNNFEVYREEYCEEIDFIQEDEEINAFRMSLLNITPTPSDKRLSISTKTKDDIKNMCMHMFQDKQT